MAELPTALPVSPALGVFLQGLVKDSLWATLVFYLVTVSHPTDNRWYWQQIEQQRTDFFETRLQYESRKDAQVKEIENQCHAQITTDLALSEKNRAMIEENNSILKNLQTLIEQRYGDGRKP